MQEVSAQRLAYQWNRGTGIREADCRANAGHSSTHREEKCHRHCTHRHRKDSGFSDPLASELAAFQEDNRHHHGPFAITGNPNIRSLKEVG